jgi:hypothetical protein
VQSSFLLGRSQVRRYVQNVMNHFIIFICFVPAVPAFVILRMI